MMFAIIDTNSDGNLSQTEFQRKIMAMGIVLDDEEHKALYNKLDVNGNGSI